MPYHLSQIDKDALMRLRFSGESSLRENEEARSAAAELSEITGYRRLIVDVTEAGSFMSGSTLDLFKFGTEFAKGQFPRKVKIAAVNENGPQRDIEFIVNVANNRGFTIELFNDVDEAWRWLQQ